MGRKAKYATEEERQAARRESKRKADTKRRTAKAEAEGREVQERKQYETEEERKAAKIEAQRKARVVYKDKTPKKKKVWVPSFSGVDGESFVTGEKINGKEDKQSYCLLLRNDKRERFNHEGLSTWQCLTYLTTRGKAKTAYVGFALNFDFEWILKDLEPDEYKALQRGEQITIFDGEFKLQWFIGKSLEIQRLKPGSRAKNPEDRGNKDYWRTKLQDVSGFFQTSFVKALKKWGFEDDTRLHIITSGKAARGGFQFDDKKEVEEYNHMEMVLLEELMMKVYQSFKAAYAKAGLAFKPNSTTWTGPGWFANDFLKQTNFNEEHTPPKAEQIAAFSEEYKEFFGNDTALYYPFSLAYFGGRIELAGVGRFHKAFNYDINSAYPYALSLLPRWTADDFKVYIDGGKVSDPETKAFLDRRLMGMYGVRFKFPAGWSWYPFPVRAKGTEGFNVFYPRQGFTHVMSPELFAVLDTLTDEELKYVSIEYGYVLEHTEGYGDALERMPEEELSQTAIKTLEMADVRLMCKAASKRVGTPEEREGDAILAMAEKALKLILNSLYGKTIQQVGSHKHYNDFASAFITSTCRALLWRGIAQEKTTHNVLMTMTDGLYSLVPLEFPHLHTSKKLGDWEAEEFTYFETFKPGIYRYEHDGEMTYRVRGFLTPTQEDRERLFELTWDASTKGQIGKFPSRQFITRNLALLPGWKRYDYVRQFKEEEKDIKVELRAKRAPLPHGWTIPEGQESAFFPPKREMELNDSLGYALDFENPMKLPEVEEEIDAFIEKYDSVIGLEEELG